MFWFIAGIAVLVSLVSLILLLLGKDAAPEDYESPEDHVAYEAVLNRALNSGNVVIGNKQADGSWKIQEIPHDLPIDHPPTIL